MGKPGWQYLQSAAIPYLSGENGFEIVLITNSKRTSWIYPKGIIESDMTPEESAANEAWEEAGVTGTVDSTLLDEYVYDKWDGICSVKVFPMLVDEVLEDWDEKGMRERVLVDFEEALRLIKPAQRKGLLALASFLGLND